VETYSFPLDLGGQRHPRQFVTAGSIRRTFPLPVDRNRFFAPEWVLSFRSSTGELEKGLRDGPAIGVRQAMGFGRNKGVNDDKTEARRSSRVTMCDMVKTVSRLVRAASGFSKDDLRSRDWCDFRNAVIPARTRLGMFC